MPVRISLPSLLLLAACATTGGPQDSVPPPPEPAAPASAPKVTRKPKRRLSFQTRGIDRVQEVETAAPALSDRWLSTYVATRDAQRQWRAVPDGQVLYSGENMSVQVELQESAYLYLVYQTDDGPLFRLYPQNETENTRQLGGSSVRLPPKGSPYGDVLQLDDQPGLEKLYVIASKTKLPLDVRALEAVIFPKGRKNAKPRQYIAMMMGGSGGMTPPFDPSDPEPPETPPPPIEPEPEPPGPAPSPPGPRPPGPVARPTDAQGHAAPPTAAVGKKASAGASLIGWGTRGINKVREDGASIVDVKADAEGIAVVTLTVDHQVPTDE